jgi:Ca2+-binding EF-hand superfamily protein
MATLEQSTEHAHLAKELFRIVDTDGSGVIEEGELRRAHDVMKMAVPDVFSGADDEAIMELDLDKNGYVELNEWMQYMNNFYTAAGPDNFRVLAVMACKALQNAFDNNPDVEKEARRCFNAFAVDRRGEMVIDHSAFGIVTRALGMHLTPAQVESLWKEVDKDHNGTLEFNEFLELVKANHDPKERCRVVADLYAAFKTFDMDGDGFVTLEEMRSVMCDHGEAPLTEAEWADYEDFFKRADVDGDGKLTIEEYVKANLL